MATENFINQGGYLEKLLEYQKTGIDLGDGLKTFAFQNGTYLKPFEEVLMSPFQELWASALSRPTDDKLVKGDSAIYPYVLDDNIIISRNSKNEIPVFFSYRNIKAPNGSNGIYLNICLIDAKYQGKGIAKKLINHVNIASDAKFIALLTQNEHMVQALRPFCSKGDLYPIDAIPNREIAGIAHTLVKDATNFDDKTLVKQCVYSGGSPLYGDRLERQTNHADIRNFFENNINFQLGDAVLIVGKISHKFVNLSSLG